MLNQHVFSFLGPAGSGQGDVLGLLLLYQGFGSDGNDSLVFSLFIIVADCHRLNQTRLSKLKPAAVMPE